MTSQRNQTLIQYLTSLLCTHFYFPHFYNLVRSIIQNIWGFILWSLWSKPNYVFTFIKSNKMTFSLIISLQILRLHTIIVEWRVLLFEFSSQILKYSDLFIFIFLIAFILTIHVSNQHVFTFLVSLYFVLIDIFATFLIIMLFIYFYLWGKIKLSFILFGLLEWKVDKSSLF